MLQVYLSQMTRFQSRHLTYPSLPVLEVQQTPDFLFQFNLKVVVMLQIKLISSFEYMMSSVNGFQDM